MSQYPNWFGHYAQRYFTQHLVARFADHTAPGVLADAVQAFRCLKPGGLIAFDDYLWKPSDGSGETHAPGIAIDAFATCYADRLTRLPSADDLQAWFEKANR